MYATGAAGGAGRRHRDAHRETHSSTPASPDPGSIDSSVHSADIDAPPIGQGPQANRSLIHGCGQRSHTERTDPSCNAQYFNFDRAKSRAGPGGRRDRTCACPVNPSACADAARRPCRTRRRDRHRSSCIRRSRGASGTTPPCPGASCRCKPAPRRMNFILYPVWNRPAGCDDSR